MPIGHQISLPRNRVLEGVSEMSDNKDNATLRYTIKRTSEEYTITDSEEGVVFESNPDLTEFCDNFMRKSVDALNALEAGMRGALRLKPRNVGSDYYEPVDESGKRISEHHADAVFMKKEYWIPFVAKLKMTIEFVEEDDE